MSFDSVPKDMRGLRACKLCSLVKVSICLVSGIGLKSSLVCVLDARSVCLKGNREMVQECTSSNFDG